jgi:hypothetical protein
MRGLMTKNKRRSAADSVPELLRDLMIIELGTAGVGQREIRAIVGVDMVRVNRIVKHLRKGQRKQES